MPTVEQWNGRTAALVENQGDGTHIHLVKVATVPGPAPATEATQLAVKAAVDAVKAATDAVKSATDAGTTSTDATTASVNAANTAIVAAIVAAGNGKATTTDITALSATITATTLDEKNAIVAALLPLAGIQTNTAATVNALATVNLNLATLIGATNTNDAAMLAAITATRDNVASAHTDAQAQLAEEQNQTALMVQNNATLEAARALLQSNRDHAKGLRDTTGEIEDEAALNPADPATQIALLKGLLQVALDQAKPTPAPKLKTLDEIYLRAATLKAIECRVYRITVYQQSTITTGSTTQLLEPDTVLERKYEPGVLWISPQIDGDALGHFSL